MSLTFVLLGVPRRCFLPKTDTGLPHSLLCSESQVQLFQRRFSGHAALSPSSQNRKWDSFRTLVVSFNSSMPFLPEKCSSVVWGILLYVAWALYVVWNIYSVSCGAFYSVSCECLINVVWALYSVSCGAFYSALGMAGKLKQSLERLVNLEGKPIKF